MRSSTPIVTPMSLPICSGVEPIWYWRKARVNGSANTIQIFCFQAQSFLSRNPKKSPINHSANNRLTVDVIVSPLVAYTSDAKTPSGSRMYNQNHSHFVGNPSSTNAGGAGDEGT